MSQSTQFSNSDGVPLFACTKCNSRHPFDELSTGHQLCRDCKASYQMVKCNYCRTEYHQDVRQNGQNGSSRGNSICSKCEQLQTQHGKPGPCAYCNIIAAFIGNKCQKCTNSEKKYGPPQACEHCRQKCAFDRREPDKKKNMDEKLLCWLCTMAYKRTLAKARHKEAMKMSSHHRSGANGDAKSYSSNRQSSSIRHNLSSNNSGATIPSDQQYQRTFHGSSNGNQSHNHHRDLSSNKKQRMDLGSSSSGSHKLSSALPNVSSALDSRFIDPNNGNDSSAIITQLKDQVALSNRKIQQKEKELLAKDQQIAELKSSNAREQRELREKISTMQRQHSEKISELQTKLISMQKQIVSQTKAASRANTANYIEPPLVI